MASHPFHLRHEGSDLFGILHLPEQRRKKKFPAVLFLHGFLATKIETHRIFVKMARHLEAQGVVSLRFDFRGCGDSSGDSLEMTLASQMSDATAALNWLRRHPRVDSKRIALLGMSLGGGVAATLVGRDPRVKALVLWAPVGDLMECLQVRAGRKNMRMILQSEKVDYFGQWLGHEFFSEFELFRPMETVKSFRGPVLVLQGEKDEKVPPHHGPQYGKALRGLNPRNRFVLIPGSDHGFGSIPWQNQVLKTTAGFLVKVLK